MPEKTTSGFTGMRKLTASFRQSAGVPPMLHASMTGTGKAGRLTGNSPKIVSFWDIPLHWLDGAATQTLPNFDAASARRTMPGESIPSSFAMRILSLSFII